MNAILKMVNKTGSVKNSRFITKITALSLILLFSVIAAVSFGPINIKISDTWKIILNGITPYDGPFPATWKISTGKIVWNLRLPRVLLGGIAGGALSLGGVAIQAAVRNPLAGPFVLGISSSAATGAVSVILLGLFSGCGVFALSAGAFTGAMIGMIIVVFISNVRGRITPVRVVLTGVAVSSFFSALTNLIVHSARDEEGIRSALFWMVGSLAGTRWEYIPLPFLSLLLAAVFLSGIHRSLNAMILGDETAVTLGVNIHRMRIVTVIAAALITGFSVAVSGAIGFVGLVIPHIVRMVTGADHRQLVPLSVLSGAIYLIWADVAARLLVAPEELPIGIITSLVGAPFFVYLLRKSRYSFGGRSS